MSTPLGWRVALGPERSSRTGSSLGRGLQKQSSPSFGPLSDRLEPIWTGFGQVGSSGATAEPTADVHGRRPGTVSSRRCPSARRATRFDLPGSRSTCTLPFAKASRHVHNTQPRPSASFPARPFPARSVPARANSAGRQAQGRNRHRVPTGVARPVARAIHEASGNGRRSFPVGAAIRCGA
jgi:hypothetical protein